MHEIYPLTITADRFYGIYSGGAYLAWPLEPWDIPDEPFGGDDLCCDFWCYDPTIPVGRGATSGEAVEDLIRRIKEGEPDKPRAWHDIMRENVRRMRNKMDGLYPVTITADRYSGTYSGGAYLAWPMCPEDVPSDPDEGDGEALIFWGENTIPVGRGATPNEAKEDLIRRLETGEDEKPRTPATALLEVLHKKRAEKDENDETEHK